MTSAKGKLQYDGETQPLPSGSPSLGIHVCRNTCLSEHCAFVCWHLLSSFRPSNLMEKTWPLPWKSSLSEGVCAGEHSGLRERGWGTCDYVEAYSYPLGDALLMGGE